MNAPNPPPDGKEPIRKMLIFLAFVYVAEGLCQAGVGLVDQPLSFYLKTALGLGADQTARYLSILTIPWVIKPVFGLISDFIPILGYRRKSYLFLANGLAVLGYLWLTGLTEVTMIVTALMLTAVGMAVSSTVCGALMVETGKKYEASGHFVNQQWKWFYIAAFVSALGGGLLTQYLSPATAFHTAALLVAVVPIGVMATCWTLVVEEKAEMNLGELKKSAGSLLATFKSKTLWLVGGFLFFFNFSPSFGTPLYYHMTDNLKFSQEFIGALGALSSVGAVIGSFVYGYLAKRMTLRTLLNVSIVLGALTQASFYFLNSAESAVILNLFSGVTAMLAVVSSLTLAADYCPDGSEGLAYALLMSVNNLAGQLSMNVGAHLYVHTFNNHLQPLIWVSAAVTLLGLGLVPLLGLGNKRPGERVKKDK